MHPDTPPAISITRGMSDLIHTQGLIPTTQLGAVSTEGGIDTNIRIKLREQAMIGTRVTI
jgi:hypothetical protein